MKDKVLFVDDEPRVLNAIKRILRKRFDVEIAEGAHEALRCVAEKGPFAVIVSDLSMPDMDGIEFFERLRRSQPQTVRIMFTGNADVQSAMEAVNKGHVFRFLTKPSSSDIVMQTVEAGLEQYRLVTAEKDLLRGTLAGVIKMITQLLGLVNPEAFGRASRIKKYVIGTAKSLGEEYLWRYELAAMLSQIGCVMLPQDTVGKSYRGKDITDEENSLLNMHPTLARELIVNIPRFQDVAEMVAYQDKPFPGGGVPDDDVKGDSIPLGGRILKIALDYDSLLLSGLSEQSALSHLIEEKGRYDPEVLDAFADVVTAMPESTCVDLPVQNIRPGSILAQDIRGENGMLYFAKGMELSQPYLDHLLHIVRSGHVHGTVSVEVPVSLNDSVKRSKETPTLKGTQINLGMVRKMMQSFQPVLNQNRLGPAIHAICRALEAYMSNDIGQVERKELFGLLRKNIFLLSENERFSRLYPDSLSFKPGREYEVLAHLKMFVHDLEISEAKAE